MLTEKILRNDGFQDSSSGTWRGDDQGKTVTSKRPLHSIRAEAPRRNQTERESRRGFDHEARQRGREAKQYNVEIGGLGPFDSSPAKAFVTWRFVSGKYRSLTP